MKKLMMLAAAVAAAMPLMAETETVGGYTWTYQINGDTVEISGVSPSTGAVTIPSTLGGKPVTRIGAESFRACDKLTRVTIPVGIESIGRLAFYDCESLASVTIPNSVTNIGNSAFCSCSCLESVTIPSSVTSIEDQAFYGCDRLMDENGYVIINNILFYYGYWENGVIDIPNGVTRIAGGAFIHQINLTSVTIPVSVTSIGDFAFNWCDNLVNVVFEGDMAAIDMTYYAFYSTPWLDTVPETFEWGWTKEQDWVYSDNGDGTITMYDDVNFYDTPAAIEFPSAINGKPVVAIENNCGIRQMWSPMAIAIPASVKRIGAMAFAGYQGLEQVVFRGDESEIEIDPSAFLRTDYIRNSRWPFKIIAHPYDIEYVVGYQGQPVTITAADWPTGVSKVYSSSFAYEENLKRIEFPAGMKELCHFSVHDCENLEEIVFNDDLEIIGSQAFDFARNLREITIPPSVTNIGAYAFAWCESLMKVNLPETLKGKLSDDVFKGCPEELQLIYYTPTYTVRFHKNDGSTDTMVDQKIKAGETTRLISLAKLGWTKRSVDFLGWGDRPDSMVVWKKNWANVTDLAKVGKTVDLYAIWGIASDSYAIQFIRNDGAGTWRTVGFKHGEKTRLPSLANGLGWARRGYTFKGWALTTADAAAGKVWKADWSYVATAAEKGKTLTVYAVWELKPGFYQIRFNKNDGTTKWRSLGFAVDASTKLSTIKGLGWERAGYTFKGWATSKANADAGKVWKADGATVKNATAEGKTLSIYAIWQ